MPLRDPFNGPTPRNALLKAPLISTAEMSSAFLIVSAVWPPEMKREVRCRWILSSSDYPADRIQKLLSDGRSLQTSGPGGVKQDRSHRFQEFWTSCCTRSISRRMSGVIRDNNARIEADCNQIGTQRPLGIFNLCVHGGLQGGDDCQRCLSSLFYQWPGTVITSLRFRLTDRKRAEKTAKKRARAGDQDSVRLSAFFATITASKCSGLVTSGIRIALSCLLMPRMTSTMASGPCDCLFR